MKVDTMRTIDYWLGVPLCFLASIVLAPFRGRRGNGIERVLFIELSEMGSAILADPAMRKMRESTSGELYFAIFQGNAPSLQLLGTIDDRNIFTFRDDNLFHLIIDAMRFPLWTRRKGIDTVIDLELFSRFTALLTGFSGAGRRVGYHCYHNEGLYRGSMLTHKVLYNPHIHIAKNFMALVNAAIAVRKELPYSKSLVTNDEIRLTKVSPSAKEKQSVYNIIEDVTGTTFDPVSRKLILINANASDLLVQRRWPPEHFVELILNILADNDDAVVLLTGSGAEYDEMESIHQRVADARCHNSAGCFSFDQLPALYSVAHIMVTNDSGPAHFSAVTDLKVFVLYGPETPDLYGSLGNSTPIYKGLACSPCVNAANHRKTSCRDNICLQRIAPSEVYRTIQPALASQQ